MRLGVVTALLGEEACFGAAADGARREVAVRLSGIGSERAARAAEGLARDGARALCSFGIAGGLDPRLEVGHLVVASEVRDPSGERLPCDPDWGQRVLRTALPGLFVGAIFESPVVLATRDAKQACARHSGALAVDMESAAVARVAARAGLPFLALRAISDPLGQEVPRASQVAVDGMGRLRRAALARALLVRPGDLLSLLAMHRGFRRALRTLESLVERLGPALEAPPLP